MSQRDTHHDPDHATGLLEWTVKAKDARQRLDLYLSQKGLPVSRSRIQQLIEEGRITLNEGRTKPSQKLRAGDRIAVQVPRPAPTQLRPEPIPLRILYEDEHLLVIDKPAGLVVHPAPGHYTGTLVHALLFHCRDLSGIGGQERPGLVHRLDKETSGVMVVAKGEEIHRDLAGQFKGHTIERDYCALVHGIPKTRRGRIELAIGRDLRERKKFSARTSRPREAVTIYEVAERFAGASLLVVRPQTGRTHQIRVHLSAVGYPVIGDKVYGARTGRLMERALGVERQMLHAKRLVFRHPAAGRRMEFVAEFPPDMQVVLLRLREDAISPD